MSKRNQESNGKRDLDSRFAQLTSRVAHQAGSPMAFALATLLIIAWALVGPFLGYSDMWQLTVNTATTIVTFLMVFLLQNAQTRDTRAIQAKLNELILTSAAENRFIGIENLDEEDLKHLDRLVAKAAKRSEDRPAGDKEEGEGARKPQAKQKRRRVVSAAQSNLDQ